MFKVPTLPRKFKNTSLKKSFDNSLKRFQQEDVTSLIKIGKFINFYFICFVDLFV